MYIIRGVNSKERRRESVGWRGEYKLAGAGAPVERVWELISVCMMRKGKEGKERRDSASCSKHNVTVRKHTLCKIM